MKSKPCAPALQALGISQNSGCADFYLMDCFECFPILFCFHGANSWICTRLDVPVADLVFFDNLILSALSAAPCGVLPKTDKFPTQRWIKLTFFQDYPYLIIIAVAVLLCFHTPPKPKVGQFRIVLRSETGDCEVSVKFAQLKVSVTDLLLISLSSLGIHPTAFSLGTGILAWNKRLCFFVFV